MSSYDERNLTWTRYRRIIPRDLFNEAALLKCLGKLSVLAVDEMIPGLCVEMPEPTKPFLVGQDSSSGSIRCPSIRVVVHGKSLDVFSPLNSREPWPLMCFVEHDDDEYDVPVFNDDGTVTEEFKTLCRSMAPNKNDD